MIRISDLAAKRLKYNKSRSILTAIALVLITTLLTAIGSAAIGLVDFQKKTIAYDVGNHHAIFKGVSYPQSLLLEQHPAVESLTLKEPFADIIQDKLNAALNHNHVRKEGIQQAALTEGRMPETKNEIAGPPALFERLGVEPALGNKVPISFRVQGEGEILTEEFVITGLQEQADLSVLNVTDARIAFGAVISEEFINHYLKDEDRFFNAQIRVDETMGYGEIEQQINEIAAEIGLSDLDISQNDVYLMWMTDPETDTIFAMSGIALIVILLGGLVIYNIYYVSVISNIQELGKLKALGATKKQIKRLLLTEGMTLAGISLPIGLILGYLCSFTIFSYMRSMQPQEITHIQIFSLPVTLVAILAIAATTYLSLHTPMRMAARISPVEAIRYQEESAEGKNQRKGYQNVSLAKLSLANLTRNKRRTLATILTMGLTCVLFLTIATVLNNINTEDYARQTLTKGDFMISLNYKLNDTAYPENNLDTIQRNNPLSPSLLEEIAAIPGVTGIETRSAASVLIDHPAYPAGERISIGSFSRAEVEELQKDIKRGSLDYDQMLSENGILFTWDSFFPDSGFQIGEKLPLTFYDDEAEISLEATLVASATISSNDFWIPEELLHQLLPDQNLNEILYIYADKEHYERIKAALQEIEAEFMEFSLISIDEELRIAEAGLQSLKYPIYGLLFIVGVISFMSLINTMVTSILTRKRELGILQAIGLSNRQLKRMLQGEGMILIFGALLCGLVIGNIIGLIVIRVAANTGFLTVHSYHYPLLETLILIGVVLLGQLLVTAFISKYIHKETLVSRITSQN